MSTYSQFNKIDWAGLVLAVSKGFVVYQIEQPEGHITIEHHHEWDRDFWRTLCVPQTFTRTLDVHLRGMLKTWDGQERPAWVVEPLALPPTPGYSGKRLTRPAADE